MQQKFSLSQIEIGRQKANKNNILDIICPYYLVIIYVTTTSSSNRGLLSRTMMLGYIKI